VPTLQLVLSESQYEQLRDEAEKRHISVSDLVLEAVEAFLRSEIAKDRYTRLARKQAMWRASQAIERRRQPDLTGGQLVREQAAGYTLKLDQGMDARLANLRLDLVYHSEALEGSPLTRAQVEEAIRELSRGD
jgi:hypothetical protein